jgi:Right handed beta helix region
VLFSSVAVSVAIAACCLLYVPEARAQYPCSGRHVYPSQNLSGVVQNYDSGTTFCIHDGTYNVSRPVVVDDRDRFIGLYNDSSRPAVVTTEARYVFDVNHNTDDAEIKGLKISGAVGGNYCEPTCGMGIYGGYYLTVENVRLTNNANNGIGGAGIGLLVKNSRIDHNGRYSFTGLDGGPSQSAGIKSARGSLTVLNSRIQDNYWVGLWCDEDCDAFTVKNSTITGHGKAGIHDEISNGPAVISGNTIRGNGILAAADRHAGLLIMSSANVDAYNNSFGANIGDHWHPSRNVGVAISEDARAPKLGNIRVHDNTMNGDGVVGCELAGVTCYGN